MIKGREIIFKIRNGEKYVPAAASKSCVLNVERDKIEVASPTSGKWKAYKQTTMGATIDVSGLVSDNRFVDAIMMAMARGESMEWLMTVGSGCQYYGRAIVDSNSVKGDVGSLAGASMRFTVDDKINHHHVYRKTERETVKQNLKMVCDYDLPSRSYKFSIDEYTGHDIQRLVIDLPSDTSIDFSGVDVFMHYPGYPDSSKEELMVATESSTELTEAGVKIENVKMTIIKTYTFAAGVHTLYFNSSCNKELDVVTSL